jgi:hypothetical protein
MRSSRIVLGSLALIGLAGCGGAPMDSEEATAAGADALLTTESTKVSTVSTVTIAHPIVNRCIPCTIPRQLDFLVPLDTVPSGSVVDTAFPGLTFSVVNWVSGAGWTVDPKRHVYAVTVPYQPTGTAPTNGLTVDPGPYSITMGWQPFFRDVDGSIQVTFASPVAAVSVNAETIYSGPNAGTGIVGPAPLPFLDVWGVPAAGGAVFLGQVVETVGTGGPGVWTTITNAPGPQIGSIVMGPQPTNSVATANVMFQNLTYR